MRSLTPALSRGERGQIQAITCVKNRFFFSKTNFEKNINLRRSYFLSAAKKLPIKISPDTMLSGALVHNAISLTT
jgi:hypothetical protein